MSATSESTVTAVGVLPTGPEDITHWPERDQLWTLTEWPGRRWVYSLDAGRWSGRAE